MSANETPQGPDLTKGIAAAEVPQSGVLAGRVGDDQVLLARVDGEVVAVAGACSHYSGPLKDGLRVGDTIACPWHHACFDLKTGRALKAPALAPIDRWKVEADGGRIVVREKLEAAEAPKRDSRNDPKRIVIVGGGAAGFAAAQRLRDLGFSGELVMLSDDGQAPYDRPNVSKDYLAGQADPAWMPLKDEAFYADNKIDLRLGARAVAIDAAKKTVALEDGGSVGYDRLLVATGAEPNHPKTPGFDADNVFTLRSQADSDRIIAAAGKAGRVAVIGASFIGLEAAASMRARGLETHVIAPETAPLESKLGPQLSGLVKGLHDRHGVSFHLGRKVEAFEGGKLKLDDGSSVGADLVILGVGVKPRLDLAGSAGVKVDGGVIVDASMRTSDAAIFAAGDIARYPQAGSGEQTRVEHWVVAERQGQTAAAAMLGLDETLDDPAFFWSAHFGVEIRYVGHAERWDEIEAEGSFECEDASAEVRFIKGGRVVAVATVGRDLDALKAAEAMPSGKR